MIGYSEQCWICDLQRRFSFGIRDQTWPLRALGDSDGKESAFGAVDLGSVPGLGRSPREANVYPLECLPTLVFLPGKSHR